MVGVAQAVLQHPLDHVGFGEKLGGGWAIPLRVSIGRWCQFGVDAVFGLLLVELEAQPNTSGSRKMVSHRFDRMGCAGQLAAQIPEAV